MLQLFGVGGKKQQGGTGELGAASLRSRSSQPQGPRGDAAGTGCAFKTAPELCKMSKMCQLLQAPRSQRHPSKLCGVRQAAFLPTPHPPACGYK